MVQRVRLRRQKAGRGGGGRKGEVVQSKGKCVWGKGGQGVRVRMACGEAASPKGTKGRGGRKGGGVVDREGSGRGVTVGGQCSGVGAGGQGVGVPWPEGGAVGEARRGTCHGRGKGRGRGGGASRGGEGITCKAGRGSGVMARVEKGGSIVLMGWGRVSRLEGRAGEGGHVA